MHSSPRKWMRVFQLCSLKIKSSRFLTSAPDVGLMVKVALSMVLNRCPRSSVLLLLFSPC